MACYRLFKWLEISQLHVDADTTNYRQQLMLISRVPMQLLPHGLVMLLDWDMCLTMLQAVQ